MEEWVSDEARKSLSKSAIKRGVVPPSNKGIPMSEATKWKLSKAHSGKKLSKEHCEKLAIAASNDSRAARLWRCEYSNGHIVESIGLDSFGVPTVTLKRLYRFGRSSAKHGISKFYKVK